VPKWTGKRANLVKCSRMQRRNLGCSGIRRWELHPVKNDAFARRTAIANLFDQPRNPWKMVTGVVHVSYFLGWSVR